MNSENFTALILSMRSLRVSPDFIQGMLFTLGGILLRSEKSAESAVESVQWVLPHEIDAVSEDIFGRLNDELITQVIEEFFYRINVKVPLRQIRINDFVTHLFAPADHGLLPKVDLPIVEIHAQSRLYYTMLEEIGRRLKPSRYSDAEAYLAGICFFSFWIQIDMKATNTILHFLDRGAPPVAHFFFALPRIPGAKPSGWLPTQMAYWALISATDELFTQVAWPYQSWMLFLGGRPRPGIEDLTPTAFFDHCHKISIGFFAENQPQIRAVANFGYGPEDVPAWSGKGADRSDIFKVIEARWGYNPENETLPEIELKQMNACIIFTLFCSLCRAATLN